MKIKLSWINRNTIPHEVKVYRSEAPFEDVAQMTPLATLESGAQEYEDTTLVQNKVYYYRIQISDEYNSYLTKPVTISTHAYNGPGPQEFIWGDFEKGYFGEISVDDLISAGELAVKVELYSGTVTTTLNKWHKFARKGKVLYIPNDVAVYNVSWNTLYELGLVFGDASPEERDETGITNIVEQNKIIEIKGEYFRVRLPKALPDDKNSTTIYTPNGYSSHEECIGSELDELILPLLGAFYLSVPGPIYSNLNKNNFVNSLYVTLCQESANNGAARVTRSNSTYPAGVGFIAPTNTSAPFGSSTSSRTVGFRPILEYVFNMD